MARLAATPFINVLLPRQLNRTRGEAKSSERRDQPPLPLFKFKPPLELTPTSLDADSNADRRCRHADHPDDPLPERLRQDPSRPLMRGLISAPAAVPA
jgi:hypothetical protein